MKDIYNKVLILNSDLVVEQNIVTANKPIQDNFISLKLNGNNFGNKSNIEVNRISFKNKEIQNIVVVQDSEADLKGEFNTLQISGEITNRVLTTLKGNLFVCQIIDTLLLPTGFNLFPLSTEQVELLSNYFMSNIVEYENKRIFNCYYTNGTF